MVESSEVYGRVEQGTDAWNALSAPASQLYPWRDDSTYIHNPPFFAQMVRLALGFRFTSPT
jgi:aconitate hydratase